MLIVGKNKSDLLDATVPFLFVDDGRLIDRLTIPPRRKVVRLDLSVHSLNPLQGMDYRKACDFLAIINAIFPEGESTLTKKSADYELMLALTQGHERLDKLIRPKKDNPGSIDAHMKIQRLLLSPVLKKFLTRPTNFSLDGTVLVRLDNSLARFDRFVIANVLIASYKGHVVIPDFGFYGCPFHLSLIDEGRLSAGVNFLDESPLKNQLLLIEKKLARKCTADDAATLATFSGLTPGRNNYDDFIQKSIA